MNATFFGVPSAKGNITAVIWATDEAGLYCTTEVLIIVEEGQGWWPERLTIVAAVIGLLVVILAVLHCIFMNAASSSRAFSNFKLT